jgi:hypothetical protein
MTAWILGVICSRVTRYNIVVVMVRLPMTTHTGEMKMSLEDAIKEIEALNAAREREKRERPGRLWRDVVVMARELNNAMQLARREGLNVLVTVHDGQVVVNYLEEEG